MLRQAQARRRQRLPKRALAHRHARQLVVAQNQVLRRQRRRVIAAAKRAASKRVLRNKAKPEGRLVRNGRARAKQLAKNQPAKPAKVRQVKRVPTRKARPKAPKPAQHLAASKSNSVRRIRFENRG